MQYILTDSTEALQQYIQLPACYELGYFQSDSLLHPEITTQLQGFSAVPLTDELWRDDWITGLMLLCILLHIYIIRYIGGRFLQQAQHFFFPTRERTDLFVEKTSMEKHSTIMVSTMVSLIGGIWFYICTQNDAIPLSGLLPPYILIAIFTLCWLVYFGVKHWLYTFVNWIFFDTNARSNWKEAYAFLISVECFVFFPVIIISIYLGISFHDALWTMALFAIIIKLLLILKAYHVFFRNFSGVLHLLLYLCTLEAMPLLALAKSVFIITDSLIVKL